MKDEIKEIIELQNKIKSIENETYSLTYVEWKEILDYITNLQERCEYLERSNNRREDEIMSLRDECVDGETYKSRNEKAIEYIKELCYIESENKFCAYGWDLSPEHIVNILQGEDNTPENLYKYTPEKGFRLVGDDND